MNKKYLLTIISSFLLTTCICGCSEPISYMSHDGHNFYRVEFDTKGGSPVEALFTDELSNSPLSTKEGYYLSGWYIVNETDLISFPYIPNNDVTLKALWTKETYNVHFETNGGSPVSDLNNINEIAIAPLTNKDGFTFLGWHLSSFLDDEAINYPYVLNKDITLYASWKRNEIIPFGVNLVNAKVDAMEAKSYWSFSYDDESLVVNANVIDEHLYGYSSNFGFNDNVEIVLTRKQDYKPSGLNLSDCYHFLVDINGNNSFNFPKNEYSWSTNSQLPQNVSVKCVKTNIEQDGFNGYKATFDIPYSLYGLNRESALNNLMMSVGLRNTNSYSATKWEASFNNNYLSCWSYYILGKDGDFIQSDVDPSTLVIGGSNYLLENYSNLNTLFSEYNAFAFAEEIDLEKWQEKIDYFLNYSADKIILNIGRYDYYIGKLSSDEIIDNIELILNKCLTKYSADKISITSIEPLKNYASKNKSLKTLNDSLYAKCVNLGINYIDTYSMFIKDEKIDLTFFKNNFVFSSTGYSEYWGIIKSYL